MLLNVAIASCILFLINSCMVPVHFVGYQFRVFKSDKKIVFSDHLKELSEPHYLSYIIKNCHFYFHKKNAHHYAVCQRDKDIYFVGTDVRSDELHHLSNEDILAKLDTDSVDRIQKIKTTISGLSQTISAPSFVVYRNHEIDDADQ